MYIWASMLQREACKELSLEWNCYCLHAKISWTFRVEFLQWGFPVWNTVLAKEVRKYVKTCQGQNCAPTELWVSFEWAALLCEESICFVKGRKLGLYPFQNYCRQPSLKIRFKPDTHSLTLSGHETRVFHGLLLIMLLSCNDCHETMPFLASRALYWELWLQRSISRALMTGNGWDSWRVWALRIYQPKGLFDASSYDLACVHCPCQIYWTIH